MFRSHHIAYPKYRGGPLGMHSCPNCRASLQGDFLMPRHCDWCGWGMIKGPVSRN